MLLTQGRFEEEVLTAAQPVLVDFSSTWCGPCKIVAPVVHKLAGEGYHVCKVDIGARPDLARRYGISALPTLVILKDGREVQRLVGVQSERTLRAALDRAALDRAAG